MRTGLLRNGPILVVLLLGLTAPCRGEAFVGHFEPPVLERGKTTRMKVVGSGFGKPVGLWSTLPSGSVRAVPVGESSATSAVFDVTVAADTPVGICGVRLATEDGLANACLVLIDDLPVRPGEKADVVALPASVWGRFREATVDRYAINVAKGQRVTFEAVGNRLGKDVDPLITLRDAKGKIVAQRDNDVGLFYDCRFEHSFAEAGKITVEIRDARFHGSADGMYVLRMGRFPAARNAIPTAVRAGQRAELGSPESSLSTSLSIDVPKNASGLFIGTVKRKGDDGSAWLPLEATDADVTIHQSPGATFEESTLAKVPGILCGILNKSGDRHLFRVELMKGQRIQIRAEARAFQSPAELEIAVTDAKGKEIRRAAENAQEETMLDFTAGAPGVYGIAVRDVYRDGGPAFAYRLDVRPPQPTVQVIAEVEGITVPRGDYQPMPLTIARSEYGGKIALSLLGAPPGVTLSPTEIDAGVNAIVCKLHAKDDVPAGIHTIQIQARLVDAKVDNPALVRTRPLIDRQIVNVDLIPHALRDDQRRPPPALTDRFALQITPAAFFTFELPNAAATLGRYQLVEFPIALKRANGFAGAIAYSAKGGQIAPKEEGRTRVYAEFTQDKGSIHSKILTNLTKHRVEVTGIAMHGGRKVALTRTFDLDVKAAYTVRVEPALVKLEPGTSAKVLFHADRLPTFDGEVAIQLSPAPGLELPLMVVIPRGKSSVEVTVKADASRTPGRQGVNLNFAALVNTFEEEQRGRLDVEIVKTPSPKK